MIWLAFATISNAANPTYVPGQTNDPNTLYLLKQTVVIEGHKIDSSSLISFHPNGRLDELWLANPDTLSGQAVPAGTRACLRDDGTLNWIMLPSNREIQGIICRGNGRDGWMTCFHPNGKLKLAWLPEDTVIQGIPCWKATFWGGLFRGGAAGTWFHDNGRLASCKLSHDTTIEGVSFKKRDRVWFDKDGRLVRK